MSELNLLAIGAAVVAAFVASSAWYAVFGNQLKALSSGAAQVNRPPALVVPVELGRNLVLATVVAWLCAGLATAGWTAAVPLAVALWIGFPAVLLSGAVFHENVPWRLAALHAGDWLVKLLIITVIVGVWR